MQAATDAFAGKSEPLLEQSIQMATCCITVQVWSTNQVEGVHRFLARSFRLVTGDSVTKDEPSRDQLRSLHTAIKRVGPCSTP